MTEQKHKKSVAESNKSAEALQAEIDNLAREYAELKEESEKLKSKLLKTWKACSANAPALPISSAAWNRMPWRCTTTP